MRIGKPELFALCTFSVSANELYVEAPYSSLHGMQLTVVADNTLHITANNAGEISEFSKNIGFHFLHLRKLSKNMGKLHFLFA